MRRDTVPDSADFTEEIERRDFLDVHLAVLKPRIRNALIAWSQGKTNQQIADAAGVTETCVRKWVRHALDQLRDKIQK